MKHTQGICPCCGSDDIEYGVIEVDDVGVYYPATCNKCQAKFNECYNIEFAEHANIREK